MPETNGLYVATPYNSLQSLLYFHQLDNKLNINPTIVYFVDKWGAFKKHPTKETWVTDQQLVPELIAYRTIEDLFYYLEVEEEEDEEENEEVYYDDELVLDDEYELEDDYEVASEDDYEVEEKSENEATTSQDNQYGRIIRKKWPDGDSFKIFFNSPSPEGKEEIQLFVSEKDFQIEPIVTTFEGYLVGRTTISNFTVYLVFDPDVADNLGLGLGQNTVFVLKLFQYIMNREDLSGPITFLEIDSGSLGAKQESRQGFFSPFLKFPMIIVAILTLLAAVFFLAALSSRFGGLSSGLLPEGRFGKSELIDNSARLMARPNLLPSALEAYQKMIVQRAEKVLHAPRLNENELLLWLDRVALAKGVRYSLSSILARAQTARNNNSYIEMMYCARDLYQFRKELESGPSHPGHSGQ
ncbi:MAG: hypothetical protein LBS44_06670 [Deltaproteobacteria bacterium]|nr:hypothetical protein [Deltaproteobacteria bacterium]